VLVRHHGHASKDFAAFRNIVLKRHHPRHKDYVGKPRSVVIVQDNSLGATDSITICAFTTDPIDALLFRLIVEPNERNGLHSTCRLMVDKITTVPKTRVGTWASR
jgi:mRNA interferase MazF